MKILKHYTIISFIESILALLILKSDYWEYSKDLYLIESCETFEMRVTMWQILNYWKRPYMKWSHSIIILISFVWKRQNNQSILANDYESCRREYCTVVIVKYKFTTVHGRRAGYTRSSCNASMGMYKNRVKIDKMFFLWRRWYRIEIF